MKKDIDKLHQAITEIDEDFGGDITFFPKVKEKILSEFEAKQGWEMPGILKYLLTQESNGLVIGNKRIFSLRDDSQRKTLVDNIERNNDADTSLWFKNRPHIFSDYLVFASDNQICFCYSKKYDLFNPSVYLCSNPNASKGVDFDRLDMDLPDLIMFMINKEFN